MGKDRLLGIGERHSIICDKFKKNKNVILPKLEKEKASLEKTISSLESKKKLTKNDYDQKFECISKLKEIDSKIKKIKKEKQLYIAKTRNILSKYRNDKKTIMMDHDELNKEYVRKLSISVAEEKPKSLHEKYTQHHICFKCNERMEWIMSDVQYVCFTCGTVCDAFPQSDLVVSDQNNLDSETQLQGYNKIGHFNEWLDNLQARGTNIPDDVFAEILGQIKKMQITDFSKLNEKILRGILKRLRLASYYEHIPIIFRKLNNEPVVVIDRETESKLKEMFKDIQTPFYEVKPKSRKKFLSYSYVLHKLCQLLGRDDLSECFRLLKSREKMINQEKIWKNMMSKLEWEFIPSV